MNCSRFLDLTCSPVPDKAQVIMLPLPFEGTVCYGKGTGSAPPAIWQASTHIEDWDEETGFNLSKLVIYSADPVVPEKAEETGGYLGRVRKTAAQLHQYGGLVFGVGGEHSLTPALVQGAVDQGFDPSELTVVQFDAHADLRDSYEGTPYSHACAMRRLVEMGANVLSVGIRSADEEEMKFGLECGRVETFYAHELARGDSSHHELRERIESLSGPLYVTIDIDCLEVHLCPSTGTPQPGGMGWWQILEYLRSILRDNSRVDLIGADLVETVPARHSQVNEVVAARLICKVLAYWFSSD